MYDFITFTSNDHDLFYQYLKIKYEVFITEFDWKSLPHNDFSGLVIEDDYDRNALFVGCISNGHLVGVSRISGSHGEKPYSTIYEKYLRLGMLGEDYAVINGVAVVAELRGLALVKSVYSSESLVTIGHRIIEEICLLNTPTEYLVLTAGYEGSANFFTLIGFEVISRPYKPDWSPIYLVDCLKNRKYNK